MLNIFLSATVILCVAAPAIALGAQGLIIEAEELCKAIKSAASAGWKPNLK